MKKNGFTLIELLVVVGIISLLVSILLPSLKKAKSLAKTVVCASNLHGLGIQIQLYASDYDNALPPGMNYSTYWENCWYAALSNHMGMANYNRSDIFFCSEAKATIGNSQAGYTYSWMIHNGVGINGSTLGRLNAASIPDEKRVILYCGGDNVTSIFTYIYAPQCYFGLDWYETLGKSHDGNGQSNFLFVAGNVLKVQDRGMTWAYNGDNGGTDDYIGWW